MAKYPTIVTVIVLIGLIGVGAYFLTGGFSAKVDQPQNTNTNQSSTNDKATTTQERGPTSIIGTSVEGRNITAYHYGQGDTELLFIGGIHGGYAWNTVLLAYELVDYLAEHPEAVPSDVTVTVIPVLNPDGLETVVGTTSRFSLSDVPSSSGETIPGRFNANNVDLNRNFDCEWQASGVWQNTKVSGGDNAFSEPESQAIKTYIEMNMPSAVIAWYSAAGGVFASNCRNGVLSETRTITNIYADASGYKAYEDFDFYETTGDMVNWIAKNNIPAISVLLSNHTDVEWDKNWKGIEALLENYAD
ncbi:hypothetical protein H7X87_03710 [Acetobacteraceae bacterium]|nr:hypothetical protein [Candidatus Parcubacteria bacterium]